MPNRLMRWFEHDHLSEDLSEVSAACEKLAEDMDDRLDESAEKTTGLRKLMEAKDCFVRAAIETGENKD